MSSDRHVVITAAGIGSRLGMNMPKCLVPVAGRRIVDYQLDALSSFDDIRIVVGFQRAGVIEHVRRRRSDVIFVCNHSYADTTVLESLFLGARNLRSPFIVLDGDVIPEPHSFARFLKAAEETKLLTTFCRAVSTDPVYADIDFPPDGSTPILRSLQRSPVTPWEWPGISQFTPEMIECKSTFVYQQLQRFLPMPAVEVSCWEVDTPADLERAEKAIGRG